MRGVGDVEDDHMQVSDDASFLQSDHLRACQVKRRVRDRQEQSVEQSNVLYC